MVQFNSLQEKLRGLLAANKTEQVLMELEAAVQGDKDLTNSVIQLKARYASNRKDDMLGLISSSDSALQNNRIIASLLELIGSLPDKETNAVNEFADKQQKFYNTSNIYQHTKRGFDSTLTSEVTVKQVLFISSNPNNKEGLRFGRELEAIKSSFEKGTAGSSFKLYTEFAVQPGEILRYMKKYRPSIVHISCHGSREKGLYFEDSNGDPIPLSSDILASFFEIVNIRQEVVECVVLSACESVEHAKAVHNFVKRAIGMTGAVPDAFAIAYAEGFYKEIAESGTYEDAHEHGKLLMRIKAQTLEYDGEMPLSDIPFIYSIEHWKKAL